ncbi:MAG: enoyl-[acyl-carrier-protein] reductase FabL [Sporolactobacillus sp.]
MQYEGKTVCISGSSRGIGSRLAVRFAKEGANVVVNYVRNGDAARETAAEVEKNGGRVLVVRANMADPEKITYLFERIGEVFGKLDVFIHSAASGRNRPAMDLDAKGWDWTLSINTRAFLIAVQQAVKLMPSAGGAVLALSSFGADHVFPYYASVGASKAALESLVRYFAVELADRRVNVNAISAGAVYTDAFKHFPEMEQTMEKVKTKIPGGRMVTADDVANLALFLCSKDAEMIRGQVIRVDGGVTLPLV